MRWILLVLALALPVGSGAALAASADLCVRAIADMERQERWLPTGLLRSIALTESGYRPPNGSWVPWPWTINSPAGAFYLDSRRDAIAKVEELQRRGISNIDVGCMQINLRFHPDAFHSLDDAFRPSSNVAYAARYLRTLYGENRNNLFRAVGRYHSSTPARRDAYARKVFARWDKDTGISMPTRHGVGEPDSKRIVAQHEERPRQRVWRGLYGSAADGPRIIERSSGGGWSSSTSPSRSAPRAPTQPRNAGQITFR